MREPDDVESLDEVTDAQARRSMAAAHRPALAVSGPYGHPVHPLLVTVPIGAFVATLAFDVASRVVEGRAYGRPAVWLSAIGIVTGLFASIFGLLDYRRLTGGTPAHKVATTHMLSMGAVLLCFVVGFFFRRADPEQYLDGTPIPALVLSAIGVVVLVVGGWLGGRLAYGFGVRVADEEDQLAGHAIVPPRRSATEASSSGE